eukprot:516309-Pyramimonas_sp.AAC.2
MHPIAHSDILGYIATGSTITSSARVKCTASVSILKRLRRKRERTSHLDACDFPLSLHFTHSLHNPAESGLAYAVRMSLTHKACHTLLLNSQLDSSRET